MKIGRCKNLNEQSSERHYRNYSRWGTWNRIKAGVCRKGDNMANWGLKMSKSCEHNERMQSTKHICAKLSSLTCFNQHWSAEHQLNTEVTSSLLWQAIYKKWISKFRMILHANVDVCVYVCIYKWWQIYSLYISSFFYLVDLWSTKFYYQFINYYH